MLKTNSKKVKEKLEKYILQYADVGDGESAETIEEACRYIAEDFKSRC